MGREGATVKTIPLGKVGPQVSAIGLGTAYYGTRIDKASAFALLDQYYAAGGRFVDTANCYAGWTKGSTGGDSERVIGEWLRTRGNRTEMFVATKVGIGYPGVKSGLRVRQIEEECDRSLKRLGVEAIDLYYAHRDDRGAPLSRTLETFHRLVEAGKVRHLGFSNHRAWRLANARCISEANGWTQPCCVQQHYTYLLPRPGADLGYMFPINADLRDYCHQHNLTLVAYHVMLWGAYAGEDLWDKYEGEHSQARLAALRSVADELEATPNQVVLAWMLQSDPLVLPLIGPSQPQHLAENLGALEIQLSDEQMKRLNEA
jgi:aryl-alcohol dehydrogenase-like predicted oxidoreductase